MKTRIIACIIGISNVLCQKTIAQEDSSIDGSNQTTTVSKSFYMSLLGQLAIPQGSLKEYSKARGGFRIEAGKPFRKIQSFSGGLELSAIFSASKKDQFKGLEVETSSTLLEIHPFIRWAPETTLNLKPYVDVSAGIMLASTATTSEIVSYPTFLEQVLFNEETEVETTSHKDYTSSSFSYSIGTGVIIKNIVMVGIRYQHTNPLSYSDKNKVYIENNTIHYDVKHIPLDMIVVTLGISNWGKIK
jgi:hypothetical protein